MKTLSLLLIALGFVTASFAASSKYQQISHEELQTAIAKKSATVLDVNGTDSYQEGRIPGAIDFVRHEDRIAALLPKDKNALIVAYCGNEHCPAYLAAANKARELGYTNVRHYAPGIDGWKKAGAKVEKS